MKRREAKDGLDFLFLFCFLCPLSRTSNVVDNITDDDDDDDDVTLHRAKSLFLLVLLSFVMSNHSFLLLCTFIVAGSRTLLGSSFVSSSFFCVSMLTIFLFYSSPILNISPRGIDPGILALVERVSPLKNRIKWWGKLCESTTAVACHPSVVLPPTSFEMLRSTVCVTAASYRILL